MTGLDAAGHMATRRWYYLIPREGTPARLVHAIERHNLDALPGEKKVYAGRTQLEEGLTSFYRWEGKSCSDPEVRLTIKTVPACLPGLRDLFADRHPYEVPQFVAWSGEGSEAYAAWVRGEVTPAAPGRTPAR